jgi:hypothetical protein
MDGADAPMGLGGRTDDRPGEERQREPGDYDACVSQGAFANRRAEHLGTTDRGIVMLRRMEALGACGRQAAEIVIATDNLPRAERECVAAEGIRKVLSNSALSRPSEETRA